MHWIFNDFKKSWGICQIFAVQYKNSYELCVNYWTKLNDAIWY